MKRKKLILILALSAVFVLALVLALLGKFVFGWFDGAEEEPYVPPTLEEGEAYYYFANTQVRDVVLMYPQLERSDIVTVRVHNTRGENYYFYHNIVGSDNYFVLGECEDETWEVKDDDLYYPSIIGAFGGTFDYTSLYDDTTTLPAMLAAVGAVRIGERLRPEDGNFSEEWLSHYGLAASDSPAYFEIVSYLRDGNGNYIYTDGGDHLIGKDPDNGKYYYLVWREDLASYAKGEEYTGSTDILIPKADTGNIRRVYVGSQTVDDTGYYLRLEGRDTVYTTTTALLSDVVNRGVGYYVAPRSVTAAESSYANQISPNLSIYHGKYSENAETVISALMSVGVSIDDLWTVDTDGWVDQHKAGVFRQIDLSADDCDPAFLSAFVGAHIGESRDILLKTNNLADPGERVTYVIERIDGVMDGNTYVTAEDAPARMTQAADTLIVTYRTGGEQTWKGLIELTDPYLPASVVSALTGKPLGDLDTAVSFEMAYTAENAAQYEMTLGLLSIISITDSEGNAKERVGYKTAVTLRFYLKHGEELLGESDLVTLYLPSEEAYDNDDAWTLLNGEGNTVAVMRAVAALAWGRSLGEWDEAGGAPETGISYPIEVLSDFTMYRGAKADYVNAYEEEISFGFSNTTSVYFGSSRYAITGPGERALYGLDADASLYALKVFQDLAGDETVALGLDDETIRRYGLYAYRIVYDLPFDCYSKTDDDDNTYYYYKSTIRYELFVSEKQPDGSRYVGSTLYDNVVKYEDGSGLDFVEWTFEETWVQNNLLLISYRDLRSIVFDLNFDEADGSDYNHIWAFDTSVDRHYLYKSEYYVNGELKTDYSEGARLYAALVDGGAHDGMKSYDALKNLLSYNKYTNNEDYSKVAEELQIKTRAGRLVHTFGDKERFVEELLNDYRDLDEIYGLENSDGTKTATDAETYVQTLLQIMNLTRFFGSSSEDLTEEEMEALLSDENACVMTIALTLRDENNKNYGYTLRFYNYSLRSLVSITDEATGRETHHFYIQAREVAKIAQAVVALTRGEEIDIDHY